MIIWPRSNVCSSCGKKPQHRFRKNVNGAVWVYSCNECWPKFWPKLK